MRNDLGRAEANLSATTCDYTILGGSSKFIRPRIRAIRDIRDGSNGRLFAGDDVVNAAGLDVKAEPSLVITSVGSLNVLVSPVSIGTSPTGTATDNQPAPSPT